MTAEPTTLTRAWSLVREPPGLASRTGAWPPEAPMGFAAAKLREVAKVEVRR